VVYFESWNLYNTRQPFHLFCTGKSILRALNRGVLYLITRRRPGTKRQLQKSGDYVFGYKLINLISKVAWWRMAHGGACLGTKQKVGRLVLFASRLQRLDCAASYDKSLDSERIVNNVAADL
jgi:hypothetical protein